MTGRDWRVVRLDDVGDVRACFGYFVDEPTARRVQVRFAHAGAVVQYQPPPTEYPWTIVEPRVFEGKRS